MKKLERFLEVIDRTYAGPILEEREFDRRYVTEGVARVVKKYDVQFDRGVIIQQDDAMLDRLWDAGVEFLEACGIYNTNTQRLMIFSRDEIESTLELAPSEVTIGHDEDARIFATRSVEDKRPPQASGGPIGTPLSEELYVPIMQSYFQEPLLDIVVPGTLATSYGRAVRAKSPLEVVASWQEVDLVKTAAERAGRAGLSVMGVEMSMSDLGHLSAISRGGYRPSDTHIVAMIGEMKTNNELLNKVAHSIRQEGVILGFYNPILGGLAGGPEGVALLIVAGMVGMHLKYMPDSVESCPTHPFLFNSTHPDILSAVSAASAAIVRNSHLLIEFMTSPVGGPGTETVLYESVAMATVASTCGASRVLGVRSGVGVVEDHCSGLETRFNAEVARAAAGLSREEADGIVKQAVAKYEPLMDQKPTGQSFSEVYDLNSLQPKGEWRGIYEGVKAEVLNWGLRFS